MFTQNHWDGQNHEEINASKAFQAELDKKVNEIIEGMPDLLRPIIAAAAKDLAEKVPPILQQEDPITHDALDEKAIYLRLLFKCSNQLGHGCSWLR